MLSLIVTDDASLRSLYCTGQGYLFHKMVSFSVNKGKAKMRRVKGEPTDGEN